jgi:hypothetical protein
MAIADVERMPSWGRADGISRSQRLQANHGGRP